MRKAPALLRLRAAALTESSCKSCCCCSYHASVSVQDDSTAHASLGYEVKTIVALPRSKAGRHAVKQYRKVGRVPAILFSLPGEKSQLLTLERRETDKLLREYGRSGLASRLFSLQIVDEAKNENSTYPVLPKMVHRTAVTEAVENITFLYSPPERIVRVDVPVAILGEDVSPGIKKGGFVHLIRRQIKCKCLGSSIPASIEVDVSDLDLGGKVGLDNVAFPPGVVLAEKHLMDPVCKIAGRAARD